MAKRKPVEISKAFCKTAKRLLVSFRPVSSVSKTSKELKLREVPLAAGERNPTRSRPRWPAYIGYIRALQNAANAPRPAAAPTPPPAPVTPGGPTPPVASL